MKTLDQLPLLQTCYVYDLCADGSFRRRMLDLGIVSGTKITAVHKSILGDPVAYEIRGAVLALRKEDAKKVRVLY